MQLESRIDVQCDPRIHPPVLTSQQVNPPGFRLDLHRAYRGAARIASQQRRQAIDVRCDWHRTEKRKGPRSFPGPGSRFQLPRRYGAGGGVSAGGVSVGGVVSLPGGVAVVSSGGGVGLGSVVVLGVVDVSAGGVAISSLSLFEQPAISNAAANKA
jgi:hypothetical protein